MLVSHLLAVPAIVSSVSACQPAEMPTQLTIADRLSMLQGELGFTAVSLTLCDFQLTEIASIRASLAQSADASALLAARASIVGYEQQIAAMKESAGEQGVLQSQEFQQVLTSLALSRAAAASLRTQVLAALRVAVPSSGWEVFDRVRAAPANIPAEMRVLAWSPAELEALTKAVFEERKAVASQSPLAPSDIDLLQRARTSDTVVAAAQRLVVRVDQVGSALRGNGS